MKNLVLTILIISLSAVVFYSVKLVGETSYPLNKNAVSDERAPRECITVFKDFFQYVYKGKKDIVKDTQAQDKWLSKNLKDVFTEHIKVMSKPGNEHDFPYNGTFVGSWEFPASFSIVGSRRYGNRSIIDVQYKWGKGQNYEGDERLTSFIFVLEDGKWKLDDIYTFRGEFISEGSLVQDLKTANKLH